MERQEDQACRKSETGEGLGIRGMENDVMLGENNGREDEEDREQDGKTH